MILITGFCSIIEDFCLPSRNNSSDTLLRTFTQVLVQFLGTCKWVFSILSDVIFDFSFLYIHLITSVTSYYSCSDSTHRNFWSVKKIRTRPIYQSAELSVDTRWLKTHQYEHNCCLIHAKWKQLQSESVWSLYFCLSSLLHYTDYITDVCHKCLQNVYSWYIWKLYCGLLIKPIS